MNADKTKIGFFALPARLGLRPLGIFLFVTELETCSAAIKAPVDLLAGSIHLAIPDASFSTKDLYIRKPSRSQALSGEQADFDLSLVEPTSVLGCVVDGEPIPDLVADLVAKCVG